MRATLLALILTSLVGPRFAAAQDSARHPERGVFLTLFRSPATGVELRSAHAAVNFGFYPTIVGKDGKRGNVNFMRMGVSYYLKSSGASPYLTPSMLFSLDKDWKSGALTELGYRGTLYQRLSGRLGVGVLTTMDGLVRVNPTIGVDFKLGGAR